jgi:hypothetical protein
MKFHKNLSYRGNSVTCRKMDIQTDMAKPVVAFHNYVANMPVREADTMMFHYDFF